MDKKPNVVYILADDLGYGDIAAYCNDSKIPTPNIDKLATQGMMFTDAHASTAVCTPSRYGILTGRYCWRSWLKTNVLGKCDTPLLKDTDMTVGHLYQEQGYHTGCIGKWHLGMRWPMKNGGYLVARDENYKKMPLEQIEEQIAELDYTAAIMDGPVDHGFDSYAGPDVPNHPPYAWIHNHHIVEVPTVYRTFTNIRTKTWNPGAGIAVKGFQMEDISEKIAEESVAYITAHKEESFFLYLPLAGPHSPIAPAERFLGKSGAGKYGDYVYMMDWTVGQVMETLEKEGLAENTIVIFTSDNGPEKTAYERIREHGHYSMGHMRGVKRDNWEGGHRVPFIVRWSGQVAAESTCTETISLLDFYATSMELLGLSPKENGGEDSLSFLAALKGNPIDHATREGIVYTSDKGKHSLRLGEWVYIDHCTGDSNAEPEWYKAERGYCTHHLPKELFHLGKDPMQRNNCYEEHLEIAASMKQLLDRYITEGKSVGLTK